MSMVYKISDNEKLYFFILTHPLWISMIFMICVEHMWNAQVNNQVTESSKYAFLAICIYID